MPNDRPDDLGPYGDYLTTSILAAKQAGDAIQAIYQTDFTVDYKEDHSPLTQADKASHDIIMGHLRKFGLPILSEEGRAIPYLDRKAWQTLWIVDPLDGTKEFIKKNGEFTVNIALVEDGRPILGVVYAPDSDRLYFGMQHMGAFKIDDPVAINDIQRELEQNKMTHVTIVEHAHRLPLAPTERPYTIVGSRSHATPDLEKFVAHKREVFGEVAFIPAGSSLKICLVAEGRSDIYPRLAPTMEWDTAAGHAVAEYSGARIYDHESGNTLMYNKENLLNPWFVVEGFQD